VKILVSGCLTALALLAAGAPAPLSTYTAAERRHWAFLPRAHPQPPEFAAAADRAWARAPLDAFVLARLKKEGLAPSPRAARRTLIRRLYFDLTGLPPAPAEVEDFLRDRSPAAWQEVIERLLASPRYGERWGQHWLDVVRFAETDGFEYDTHRREAWRYRDYVIRAFNDDKPYDRFVLEQLAGDEIAAAAEPPASRPAGLTLRGRAPNTAGEVEGPAPGEELLIAAGFNRLGPLRKNAGNQEVASSRNEVLTEMTNIAGSAFLGLTLGCARCHDHKFDPLRQSDYYRLQAYFAATHEHDLTRASAEEQAAWKARAEPLEAEIKELRAKLQGLEGEQRRAVEKRLEGLQARMPEPLPAIFSVAQDPGRRTAIHVLGRGDWASKGEPVGMRPPGVLLPPEAPELASGEKLPRAALARWISDPANPLTSRVMVNRIWQHHFGRGIVGTANDFGRMGERPTHPELLDYLANEFVASGFSVKHVHRLILLSNTWQQSSSTRHGARTDPENRLLWKFSRRRLGAEEIRDAMLAVSGRLNLKPGGPSVMVPIEQELVSALYKPAQWQPHPDPAEHNRRSVYLIAKRNLRLPFMEAFDAPDLQVSCPRRESSTHAPQALELLNGALANQQAAALTARLVVEPRAKWVDLAFRLAAGRPPGPKERRIAGEYLKTQPLGGFALAVFSLNAFLYVE